ncbi:DNA-3-methyladenine glycosylase I [Levilactobacillus bambusae]|uniref:DNA-3-methyladenine glycosylase I n=1 Tax=Levilactobacillus bambusae TaxID=2024736 RepID=A0A2V1MWY6_9LACO|nr:DNA-3-methyladenine glycosylase I [Levilactobacillus bambusae]PWF99546.1 hypothetical protein DCM90_08875 [Levilactobacillus bambusae]
MVDKQRCHWAEKSNALCRYHDEEWGVFQTDETALFEAMALEIFQAGLRWELILRYRPALRKSFYQFDPQRLAVVTPDFFEARLRDETIIQNRVKIQAVLINAKIIASSIAHGEGLNQLIASVMLDPMVPEEKMIREFESLMKAMGIRRMGPKTCRVFLMAVGRLEPHEEGCQWRKT